MLWDRCTELNGTKVIFHTEMPIAHLLYNSTYHTAIWSLLSQFFGENQEKIHPPLYSLLMIFIAKCSVVGKDY